MKCPKCDLDNPETSRFCSDCGTQLLQREEISATHTETLIADEKELATGTTFAGRYQIIEELGIGGMGRVYKAFDKEINAKIALKIIKPEAADEKTMERFRNEIKLARDISHKNVCRMYDLNKEEETYFITMEYVPGEDLKSFIKRAGPLSTGKAIFITKQVGEGLAEAHRLKVVHRDLKPKNIMIDREGNARIMDFGIARSIKAKGITEKGISLGTPKYMSPEQMEGKEVDRRSDLYSLGIIIYEMVTGRVPFEGETALALAFQHKTEIPIDPRELNPQLLPEFSQLILKCLEKDKEKRFQDAEELLAELKKIEKEIPITEKIRIETKRKGIKRKRIQAFRYAGILVLISAIIVFGYFLIKGPLKFGKPEVESVGEMRWKSSIAVLPVEDLSLKKDQEPLCEGMLDDIITKLSSIEELRVVPKLSVINYKNKNKDIKEIGRELQVDHILVPTLQRENNSIRVNIHLINAKEGFLIKPYRYEGNLEGYFKLQDDISNDIANALEVRFVGEKFATIKTREPANVRAYEYYVMGKHFIEREYFGSEKEEHFKTGIGMYEKAVEIEPNYALAYWGLGNAYENHYNKPETKENPDLRQKYLDLMLKNYKKAYEIAPNLAEANLGLGWVYFYLMDNDKSFQFFKRAFEIDPNKAMINQDIGSFFRSIGLFQQAIKFYTRAIELDPLSPTACELCAICYFSIGEFEEATIQIKKALEINTDDYWLHLNYARQLIMKKKYKEAEKEIATAEKIAPGRPRTQHLRAFLLATKGEKEKALRLIKERAPYRYDATSIYSLLGLEDEAIKYIEEGIEAGFERVSEYMYSYPYLKNNPCYKNLRNDPRFKGILKKEKKKYDEKLNKYGSL
jgi:TolB-like protein/tetratricopeptide (TPR) repeat protein